MLLRGVPILQSSKHEPLESTLQALPESEAVPLELYLQIHPHPRCRCLALKITLDQPP